MKLNSANIIIGLVASGFMQTWQCYTVQNVDLAKKLEVIWATLGLIKKMINDFI